MTEGAGTTAEPASFRDPAGTLIFDGQRVFRRVHRSHAAAFDSVVSSNVVRELVRAGRVVSATAVTGDAVPERFRSDDAAFYEHPRIPIVAYPAEWSPAMLADAADFMLALAIDLLKHGLILKDATPANILHHGCRPLLVDVPSIVERPRGNFIWFARHQFESCFVLPLIAAAEAGVPIAWSLADPVNGLTHQALGRMLGIRRWLKPSLISAVALPSALSSRPAATTAALRATRPMEDRRALYILERGFEQLRARIQTLTARVRGSHSDWGAYTGARAHYGDADIAAKRQFVSEALTASAPAWVLDIGANTGEFSQLAARTANVVAADIDEASVNRIFESARRQSLPILPMVLNIARPTPAMGWRNAETASFIERVTGRFDAVLMLAIIHHLRISCGVPLASIVDLARDICHNSLIVEFVPIDDPMFKQLARGREPIYTDWSRENFESLLSGHFVVKRSLELANRRTLYFAQKRA